jgi:hypothetical protein
MADAQTSRPGSHAVDHVLHLAERHAPVLNDPQSSPIRAQRRQGRP